MDFKKQFGKNILTLVLFMVLMTPTVVQFSHMFEGHQHEICTKNDSHIHNAIKDCEICSFHFTPFTYDIVAHSDLFTFRVFTKKVENFTSLFHSFKITNTQLRAPPIYS